MSLISLRGTEPIAGYSVTERLGAGGYGEVWKAEAPGGLQKAIKFIYGYLNEEKASRELKALNRIKQIRHPFLLSLERIEVVDGQLLIVTELADSSLKDRCHEYRQQGQPGIPRAELLELLRDAADALDFLSASGLQHLDVKPENLLMVGGRVKVADFGLVKDIQDRTCSMMAGMTPVYAPPEIFDGRPNARSDQYSLAIVYQEMLTGALPFPGATAAQLASQHLHSRPRLESLPPADRPVIARALAKNPNERFPTSRAMIEALLAAGQPGGGSIDPSACEAARPANGDTTSAAKGDTAFVRNRSARRARPRIDAPQDLPWPEPLDSGPVDDAESPAPQVRNLDPISVAPDDVGLRPTLYIGIGGTGAEVLRRLRQRLNERFGDASATPVLQMLVIDTDASGLTRRAGAAGFQPDELLAVPLRRPEEYRPDSSEILQWLSRRWLYNIPRSLQTEGLRPLGRLALVDHADAMFRRIAKALQRLLATQSLAEAEQRTGMPIRDRTPRVFVVASVSGGTGSGMVLDVGYALRVLLRDMEVPDSGLCGLLIHCTSRAVQGKELAIANAYACLSELFHYGHNGYPGEPACGIEPFQPGEGPFASTYFVHMGEQLNDGQFHDGADRLAEYLYADATTPAGALLDKCRAAGQPASLPAAINLRSLGICRLGCRQGLATQVAEHVCFNVVSQWAGNAQQPDAGSAATLQLKRVVADVISQHELEPEGLLQRCRDAIERALPGGSAGVLDLIAADIVQQAIPSSHSISPEDGWQAATGQVCHLLGPAQPQADVTSPVGLKLKQAIDALITHCTKEFDRGLGERIMAAADEPAIRLSGGHMALERMVEYLRGLGEEFAAQLRRMQEQLSAHAAAPPMAPAVGRKSSKAPEALPVADWKDHLVEHGRMLLDQWVVHAARRLVHALMVRTQPLSESLALLRRDVDRLARQFEPTPPWAAGASANGQAADETTADAAVLAELHTRFSELLARFEQGAVRELLAQRGGLIRLLTGSEDALRALPGQLRAAARWEVNEALKEIDVARLALGPLTGPAAEPNRLDQFLRAAWPTVLDCGGAKRLLILSPPGATAERLPGIVAQRYEEHASLVENPGGELIACYEAEEIPLTGAASLLVRNDPQYAGVARRLHTRTDIEWCRLEPANTAAIS